MAVERDPVEVAILSGQRSPMSARIHLEVEYDFDSQSSALRELREVVEEVKRQILITLPKETDA